MEDTSKTAEYLNIAGLVVQLLLAIFALWYTVETRNLRKHSEMQLNVLERQHRLAVAPYLAVSVSSQNEILDALKKNPADLLEADSPEDLEEKAKNFTQQIQSSKDGVFVALISNPTSKLALEVQVVLYNHEKKHFLEGNIGRTVIGEKDDNHIIIEGPPYTQDELLASLMKSYGQIKEIEKSLLPYASYSYTVVLFRDIESALYCVSTPFSIDDDGEAIPGRPEFRPLIG